MAIPNLNLNDFLVRAAVADSQEVKWSAAIVYGIRGRVNPFYDLRGSIGDRRAIAEILDFKTTKGQEIVLTRSRALGGPGIQGSTQALGKEEPRRSASFRVKVGQMRKVIATDAQTVQFTVIGSDEDKKAMHQLKEWYGRQMADEIMFECKRSTVARNTLFPNGKTNRDSLTRNDAYSLETTRAVKELLAANQAQPFSVIKGDRTKAEILKYMVMGSQYSFGDMEGNSTYINLLAAAGVRGGENWLFRGGMPEYHGTYHYNWTIENGDAIGPVGAPIAPIAYTGSVIPAYSGGGYAAFDVLGGGSAANAAVTPAPLFFQYFSNAQVIGHEGVKIAADTTTERYFAVKAVTGGETGKIGIFAYQVNDGNKLTVTKRLTSGTVGVGETTVGQMTWNTGAWLTGTIPGSITEGALPIGSVVYECNAKGQPFAATIGFGAEFMLEGWGSAIAAGQQAVGLRISEKQDYGEQWGIGWKQVWGCKANQNADGWANGLVYVESAYTPPGWPAITV